MARDAKITNAASKDDVVAAKTEMVEYTNCKYSENKTRADAALISSKEYTDEQIGALKNTITPQLEQMLTNQNMILDKLIKGR